MELYSRLLFYFCLLLEQTAQDYSIVIENPPGDATDPQEWHDFFRQAFGAHVTACTVAVDNDLLVRSLVERREKLRQIEMMVEPGTSMDTLTLAGIAANLERRRRFWYVRAGTVVKTLRFLAAEVPFCVARYSHTMLSFLGLSQIFQGCHQGIVGSGHPGALWSHHCVECQGSRIGAAGLSSDKCVCDI